MAGETKKKATRESYGEALRDFAETYENLVVLDADLAAATKTGIFKKAYPERFFDCGIAEASWSGSLRKDSVRQHIRNVCRWQSL